MDLNRINRKSLWTLYTRYSWQDCIAVTVPSAIIAFVSVMIALLTPMIQALMVTLITFIISFVGSIILAIDIVIFNRNRAKKVAHQTSLSS